MSLAGCMPITTPEQLEITGRIFPPERKGANLTGAAVNV
jgi:hypothetical protein